MNNQAIIIGGGASIKDGIASNLSSYLINRNVYACNYAFKHFPHTTLCFTDRDFYKPRKIEDNPDIYEELKKEKRIVGVNHNGIEEFKLDNTLLVQSSMECRKIKSLDEGLYTNMFLCGMFALSLACFELNYNGEIFILGFDWTRNIADTHYYTKEEFNHRGHGSTRSFENHNPDIKFKEYLKFKDIKIYNVALNSNINCFEKIDYPTMYNLLIK